MDRYFIVLFPIVTIFFILTDWSWVKKMSKGVKAAYATMTALSFALFAARAAGLEIPMPTRFFISCVSPAVEAMLGLK